MQPVVTAAALRALEMACIAGGQTEEALMERAGAAIAQAVLAAWRARRYQRVVVACGTGNNGGDGYVVARHLAVALGGGVLEVWALASPKATAAQRALARFVEAGGCVRTVGAGPDDDAALARSCADALVVDALLGTGGQSRSVADADAGDAAIATGRTAPLESMLRAMARSAYLVAIDVPSGMDADLGVFSTGVRLRANETIACGARKPAHVVTPGLSSVGRVRCADIGLPTSAIDAAAIAHAIAPRDVARWLPRDGANEHKGRRGHVVCVGGGPGTRGAGRLAAYGTLRAGAGTVTLVAPDPREPMAPAPVMTSWIGHPHAWARVPDATVVGPGLGLDALAGAALDVALARPEPLVIDADALTLLARAPSALWGRLGAIAARAPYNTVLTPHPGEAARLLGISTAKVNADRLAAAHLLAARWRAVVVLKGEGPIICDGTATYVVPARVPALATAGSGDVLAGVIAALIAQLAERPSRATAPLTRAVVAAVGLHAAAGLRMARQLGTRGPTSLDVVRHLPRARVALLTRRRFQG